MAERLGFGENVKESDRGLERFVIAGLAMIAIVYIVVTCVAAYPFNRPYM